MQIACSPHGLLAQGSVGFSDVLAIKGQTSVWLRLLRLKCIYIKKYWLKMVITGNRQTRFKGIPGESRFTFTNSEVILDGANGV